MISGCSPREKQINRTAASLLQQTSPPGDVVPTRISLSKARFDISFKVNASEVPAFNSCKLIGYTLLSLSETGQENVFNKIHPVKHRGLEVGRNCDNDIFLRIHIHYISALYFYSETNRSLILAKNALILFGFIP